MVDPTLGSQTIPNLGPAELEIASSDLTDPGWPRLSPPESSRGEHEPFLYGCPELGACAQLVSVAAALNKVALLVAGLSARGAARASPEVSR